MVHMRTELYVYGMKDWKLEHCPITYDHDGRLLGVGP